jgi:isoleucyl-tRNA synthetase
LEVARQEKFIGGSLEARVLLVVSQEFQPLVEEYRESLRYLFIVSQVEIASQAVEGKGATGLAGLSVKIEKALGQKCDRCWNYSEQVGKDERYPTVCERCSAALKEIEAGR